MVEHADRSTNEKILMEGLKVTGDLVLAGVTKPSCGGKLFASLLRELAENRINMPLFIGGEAEGGMPFTCCVAASDKERFEALKDLIPDLRACMEVSAPANLLSLFPHRFNLKALGLSLMALGNAQIPLRGFCSSLSALTFITDHTELDPASAALEGCFGLAAELPRVRC